MPSLIGVVLATFLLSRALPGDPAVYFAGPAANAESVQQVRVSLGLDRSLPEQLWYYVRDLAQGSLGKSLTTGQPVMSDLIQRLPASMELTFAALILALLIAIPLGVFAAARPNAPVDHACRGIVTVAAAFPTFFLALLLVYVFYYLLGWAPQPLGRIDEIYFVAPDPVTGFYLIDSLIAGDVAAFRGSLAQLVLPATALAMFALAPIARMTRAAMLTALQSDYVRTAKANGLSAGTVLFRYAFRNALLSITNILGHDLLVPVGLQRADRAGVRLARHRLVCGQRGDRLGLCRRAGLHLDDGGDLRAVEPVGRPGRRADRPPCARPGLTA